MGLCGSGEESEVFTSGHSGGFFMLYLGGGAREVCLIPFLVRRIILCLRPHPKANTNSGQRVSECRRVVLCVAAAPPSGGHAHLLLTSRRPLT